ncbi:MAG: hypothetical protein UZ21_OP11001000965 [Microgenomates bacterium OLB22]|nr:MAG: hypothetical protein UZ21_OP11001000965 [Microgenomates bacterium OLB22]
MSTKWRDTLHPVMLGVWAGVIGFGSFARILTPYGVSLSLLDVFSLLLLVSLGLPKIRKSEIANPLVDFFAYLTIVFVLTIPFFSLRTNTYGLLYLGRLLVYVALVVQLGAMRRELLFRSFCICLLVIFFHNYSSIFIPSELERSYVYWVG